MKKHIVEIVRLDQEMVGVKLDGELISEFLEVYEGSMQAELMAAGVMAAMVKTGQEFICLVNGVETDVDSDFFTATTAPLGYGDVVH